MVVFTALRSEYLLQSTGLADPTVTANGAVGKTNSCNETVSVSLECREPLQSGTREQEKDEETKDFYVQRSEGF